MTNRIIGLALYAVIGIWGFASFAMLASEENAENPLDLTDFILIKGLAALSMLLCVLCGKFLDRHGLLPKFNNAAQ